jgi:hypothetical protein
MRFLCRIGWHKWGKWKPIKMLKTYLLNQEKYVIEGQERLCLACNKRELAD